MFYTNSQPIRRQGKLIDHTRHHSIFHSKVELFGGSALLLALIGSETEVQGKIQVTWTTVEHN